MNAQKRIQDHLSFLYGQDEARKIWPDFEDLFSKYRRLIPKKITKGIEDDPAWDLSETDVILIVYGEQVQEEGYSPLQSLNNFLSHHLLDTIQCVHLLPFYPYSSDDGFSVIDYRQVNPALGAWKDIEEISQNFRLMFDAVVNHISRESEWFNAFREGEQPYKDYFITVDENADLSLVVRPRALPLLTPVSTTWGKRHVWTTFSEDQIDLNFANPRVLLEIIDVLLFYVTHGAEIIRLDAIAYLWKEIGTSSIHLEQTHRVVKIFRAVLDLIAPWVILITETNVPHEENLSYFGEPLPIDGNDSDAVRGDEAQMVYQFSLAPLILHTFLTGDAKTLTNWADSLETPFRSATFLNFIASHDGIGVRPAEGLLTKGEIQALVDRAQDHGGKVSYRTNPDGSKSVYEINITLYDALNDPRHPNPPLDVPRFLASQAIMLALIGVPGIYFPSLFGSRNCHECVQETGRARSINRQKFKRSALESLLLDLKEHQRQVFSGYKHLLKIRRSHPSFHPYGRQKILYLHDRIFSLVRYSPDQSESILCLANVTSDHHELTISLGKNELGDSRRWIDLLNHQVHLASDGRLKLTLEPYQVIWLVPKT